MKVMTRKLSVNFHNVKIDYFNEDIGPKFPDAKDYFDLMFDANVMTKFVIDIQTITQSDIQRITQSAKSNNRGK